MTIITTLDPEDAYTCSFCGERFGRGAMWRLADGNALHVCTVCAYRCLPRIVADAMCATGYQFWDVESKVLREFYRGYCLAQDGEQRMRMERLRKARSTGDTTSTPPDPLDEISVASVCEDCDCSPCMCDELYGRK